MAADPIAVTGYGLSTSLGVGAETNWEALAAGRCGLAPIRSFDVSTVAVKEGGEEPPLPDDAPAVVRALPAPLGLLALAGLEALETAHVESVPTSVVPVETRCGIVIGSSLAASSSSRAFFDSYLGADGPQSANYAVLEGYCVDQHFERLAEVLGVFGPSLLVSNACAAGGSAIARAGEMLRAGRCARVLAMGYDALSPFTHAGFGSLLALARGRSRPFGRGRDGMKLGAGYAALHLETLAAAQQRGAEVFGLLLGFGESADAHHFTHPHPDGLGAELAMRRALAQAGLAPDDIDAIHSHATATPANDAAEAKAMRSVFGERLPRIPICASKPAVGHTLGGAGAVQAVLSLLALLHQHLPPSLNVEEPDPQAADLDLVPRGRPARLRRVLSNSFGFGGCNASV
ncbi:MAG: 3-oxoacyl-acyl-carrier-protein synthase II, partial [Caulobacteraceae bacterium]